MDLTKENSKLFQSLLKLGDISDRSSFAALDDTSMRDVSGTPDLLRNVRNLRDKLSKLESARTMGSDKMKHLMQARDAYTDLLARWPISDNHNRTSDVGESTIAQVSGGLFEDENIRKAFDKLMRRVSILEDQERLGRSASMNSLDQKPISRNLIDDMLSIDAPNSSKIITDLRHVSDVEKGRSCALATTTREFLDPVKENRLINTSGSHQNRSRLSRKDQMDYRNASVMHGLINASNDKAPPLDRSIGSNSTVSSTLRPLNDVQMIKLRKFQDDLRKEISGNQEELNSPSQASPKIVPRLSLPLENQEQVNVAMRQSTDSNRGTKAVAKDSRGTQVNFLGSNRNKNLTNRTGKHQTNSQNRIKYKRSSSAPSSHQRISSERTTALEKRRPPFVASKSTATSHSLLVNLQQLLALLKCQNPFLYRACRNWNERDTSVTSLAEVFQKELDHVLCKRKDELKKSLMDYETTASSVKSGTISLEDQSNTKRRLKKMAHLIEMKDTEIQKLQNQLEMLNQLREETIASEQRTRLCQRVQFSLPTTPSDSNRIIFLHNFAKPTANTKLKTAFAKKRSKSMTRFTNDDHVRALRDVKLVTTAMRCL